MATKYKTDNFAKWAPEAKITAVEIEKETDVSVWISGNRRDKITQYEIYHDTFEAAKVFLIEGAQVERIKVKEKLEKIEKFYAEVAKL